MMARYCVRLPPSRGPETTPGVVTPPLWVGLAAHLRISLGLVAHRALMQRRFEKRSLDALLASLTSHLSGRQRVSLAGAERSIRRAERLSRAFDLPDTCLYRALARYAVLRRAGFPAVFLMGLPRAGGGEPGHAWVEVLGRPFAESASVAEFAVTFRHPPPDSSVPYQP